MHVSRLTSKGQATIPQDIRKFLGAMPGDAVGFDIQNGKAVLFRIAPEDYGYYKHLDKTLSEWHSPEDEALFKHW